MTIYDSSGAIVYEAPITASAVIKRVLMGDYYIELTFDAVERVDVGRGCYILYNGHKFEIISNVLPDDTNNGGLRYTLRFEAQQSQMKRCKVFWRAGDNLEVSFSNTTSIALFAELIVSNVNAFLGSNNWSVGSTPPDLEKTLKTVSFNGDTCWDAVANIAETFGVEWWTEEDGDNVSLCFGKLEYGDEVEFKKGDIVSSIPSKKGDSANYGTRFYVFGSTKNLPADYGSTEEGGIVNHIVEKRLHLPDGKMYIDAWDNLAQEDIVEQVVFFDDIYPTNVDTITRVEPRADTVIDNRYFIVYDVFCDDTPFTPDNIIEGEQMQATFTSGDLIGQTFDVKVNTPFDKSFRIVPNVLDADSGIIIPGEKSNKPNVGDTFILTGITLPDSRLKEAEQSLLEAGIEYAKKNSNDTEVYDCPTNAVYCHQNGCNYDLGQKVILIGDKFGGGRSSRIQGYEKKLYDEYQATYTIGDNSAYSRLSSVEKAIQKSSYADRVGLEANIIRAKSDSTIPSDYNVYSALATLEYFLHKNRGGIVKGHTAFERGISLYGKMIKYDANKDALIFPFNVVVEKEVAWNSSPDGFDVPTFMDAVRVDNITIKKENGVLTVIGGAGGSGGGVADSVLWSGIIGKPATIEGYGITDAYTKSEVVSKFLSINGKAADSALLNGQGLVDANGRNGIPVVSSDGYTDIGKAIDFHHDTSGVDYSVRLLSQGNNKNKVYLPTATGTLALTDDIANALLTYVTLATNQDIAGIKNFINGFKIGGKSVTYNAEKNALVFPLNAIFEGEVAWNSTPEGFKVPTIMDAIQVDGDTISKEGNVLKFVGKIDSGIDESQLAQYLTNNSYATQSWVTGRGYITGINGSMVIAALGYTPYNSANFTKATIKSTLGISDWALASVKPSYSWSEIGSRPTALSQFSNDSGFITNSVTGDFSASGMVRGTSYLSTGYMQISSNIDSSIRTSIFGDADTHWGQIKAFRTGGGATGSYGSLAGTYAAGILFAMNDTHGFIQMPNSSARAGEAVIGGGDRDKINWSAKLLHSLNYSSYALPITGGTISGNLSVTGTLDVGSTITGRSKVHISAPDVSSNYAYMSVETMKDNRALCRIVSNYQASETTAINIYRSSVGIGKAYTADEMYNNQKTMALHITGNTVCTGEISWNSSRVLKNIVGEKPTYLSMEDMMRIKPYRYTWKDKRDDKIHAGGIADEVLEVLPEVIITDGEGIHSMDYGQVSFTVATSLTPHVKKHEQEIEALKRRVAELEELVTKLLNKDGSI